MMKYAMLLKTSEGHFLAASNKGAINAEERPGKITKMIENSYDRNHQRGYEASMSACIHMIFFNPQEVAIPDDVEELKKMVHLDEGLYYLNNVSGGYHGWKVRPEFVEKLTGDAKEPRLISEETFEKDFGRGYPR